MSHCARSPNADVYMFVHVRAEEDPADRPGEPGENSEGDGDISLCKRRLFEMYF